MTDEEKARAAAAHAELDKLTATYKRSERAYKKAREDLREAIVRHLKERNSTPSQVSRHTPYDRNHVGRIAKRAGVPPFRKGTVRSVRTDSSVDDAPDSAS